MFGSVWLLSALDTCIPWQVHVQYIYPHFDWVWPLQSCKSCLNCLHKCFKASQHWGDTTYVVLQVLRYRNLPSLLLPRPRPPLPPLYSPLIIVGPVLLSVKARKTPIGWLTSIFPCTTIWGQAVSSQNEDIGSRRTRETLANNAGFPFLFVRGQRS